MNVTGKFFSTRGNAVGEHLTERQSSIQSICLLNVSQDIGLHERCRHSSAHALVHVPKQ